MNNPERKQNLFMLYETYNWLYTRSEVLAPGGEVHGNGYKYKKMAEETFYKFYYYDFLRMYDYLFIGKDGLA